MSGRAHGPRVLYAARPGWLPRTLATVVLLVLAVPVIALIVAFARNPEPVAAVLAAVLLGLGTLLGLGWLRPAFLVTTEGVVARSPFRTRRVAWADVARVEVATTYYDRGATRIVRRDGSVLVPRLTHSRSAIWRGESVFDHGPDLRHPAAPTRAAIDAHVRYLRGEFRAHR